MKFGTMLYSTDFAMRPDDFAVACEERGFESVWLPEHTHIPASRRTPFPGGGELTKEYWHLYDIFVALTAAAVATKHIKVASGVVLVTERDPIVLAKEVASLDLISRGRFIFGVGAGWNAEEMENHGVAFDTRWKVLEERVAAMKEIWSKEDAAYHGTYVNFDPIWSHPKPVQKPWPQITMGASTPYGRERVARYCDGWLPIDMMVEDLAADIADLHARVRKHERKPEDIEVSIFWAADDVEKLTRYRDLGVHRAIMGVPALSESETLNLLDHYASLPAKVG